MRATARAQPNIALIKYWGKRDVALNLPAVGSISLTLGDLYTDMSVELCDDAGVDSLLVNDTAEMAMLPRVSACLDRVLGADRTRASVVSRSNFPIAAGLASSASAFAALVVAAAAAGGRSFSTVDLASLAGRASGSAARSIYGGIVELRNEDDDVAVESIAAATEWPLRVVVAITEHGRKAVSSGEAMELSRKTSPFYGRWIDDQPVDLDAARTAIAERDIAGLGRVAELNCLKMHSVMWASRPPMVYWNAATLACLYAIRELQAAGAGVFFTIDAGPQVKAVCLANDEALVHDALAATRGVTGVMTSGLGDGARMLEAT